MSSNNNPFQRGHFTYLVYRSKIHKDDIGEAGRWRTFGFYDSLMIEYKPNVTYKDCFAIRFPSAFKDRHLLGKQVFTLLPFPEDDSPKKSILLDASTEDGAPLPALPFLGIVMVEMNMLQDESGDPADCNRPLAYMEKLKSYRDRAKTVLERNKAKDNSVIKNKLSFGCQYEIMLSTNCADLCIVMRTARIEDIYLATKLIRIHFSLSDQQGQPSPRLRYQPQINTIAAMSTNLEDYGSFENLCEQNDGMAVDFRLSCNSTSAEERLLNCCASLTEDKWRDSNKPPNKALGIHPGERIGGVLGVGQYSIYMSLLDYLDLYFNRRDFLRSDRGGERSPLAKVLYNSIHPNSEETDYTVSNVRLRFCNNANLVEFEEEEQERIKYLSRLSKNQEFTEIEKFLVVLRKELSLYRNQIHFSAYMLKEALSMINDLYYTYNDLLYEENVHSYILATQLLALSGNTLKYLWRIVEERGDDLADPAAAGRRSIINAVDQLIEMVHVVVLSINSYNKSIVSHSQANLNYPNYEIQSKVNIEKYQVAYTSFVQRLCDLFPRDDRYCKNPTLAYVYLNLNENEINAKQSFAVHPFQVTNGQVDHDYVGYVRILSIASPNYRRFAHMHHMLPQLCHELGHHLRFLKRDARNKNVYYYLLEPVANQVAEQVIEYATASSVFFGSLDEARAMLRCIIQQELLDEMYDSLSGSYKLKKLPFSVLKLPIGAYLFQQLNYEQSSFNRFWNGYRDLLGLASEVSHGSIRICGTDAPVSDAGLSSAYRYLYPVNLTISALNSFLVTKCDYYTGYEQQGWAFASLWESLKESWKDKTKVGWRQLVFTLMDSGKRMNMDISTLISVVLSLSSGICSALMDSFSLPEEEVRQLPKEYKGAWTAFGNHYVRLLYTLSFYVSDDTAHSDDAAEWAYEPSSAASQNDLIKRAEHYCSQMRTYADELNRIPGLSAALSRHARRVSAACTEVQRVVTVLLLLIQEQRMLGNPDSSHSAPSANAIPIVTDRSANRIEKIMLRLRRCLASQTGVRLDPNLASRLQNESDCRRWLSAAFRMLNPKACMADAGSYYILYNEVTADLAMCAAMQFTPFGYLAYTEHQLAELPEQLAYDASFVVRVRDVVVTLLSVNSNAECDDCSGESLEKTYVCALEELSENTSRYLTNVNKAYIKLIKTIIGLIQKVNEIPALANLFPKEIDRNALIPQQMPNQDVRQYELWVEQRILDVDRLALPLRRRHNELNDDKYFGNISFKDERKEIQEVLESTTDLLGHLRTLKRICYMMNQIPEAPPKQSPWVDCFPSDNRPLSLMEHYRMLWYAMNTKAKDKEAFKEEITDVFGKDTLSAFEDEVRNQWIQTSKNDETLIAISDHYNYYYERPGVERNDEHLDQVHFVLRYYWEGNLRYRRLSRLCSPDFDWKKKKENGKADWEQIIKDWFEEWKKRPEETEKPAECKEEQG